MTSLSPAPCDQSRHSICGTTRGAGGMPSTGTAEKVVILGRRHSASKIWMSALGWLSAWVVKVEPSGEDGGVMLDELGRHAAIRLPNPWSNEHVQ